MNKRFGLTLMSFLFCALSVGAPVHADPIIIWPSDMYHQQIHVRDVLGSWWGMSEDQFVEIRFTQASSADSLKFVVQGSDGEIFTGTLQIKRDFYIGQTTEQFTQASARAIVYRNKEGLHLRLHIEGQFVDYLLRR